MCDYSDEAHCPFIWNVMAGGGRSRLTPKGSLCSGSCGFPFSGPNVARIPAFAPCGRRDAERSDILHCLTRISRKRGFDPGLE